MFLEIIIEKNTRACLKMAYKKKSTPKDLIARPVMSETSTNLSRKSSTSSTSSSSSFTSDEEEEGVSSKYVSDFSHDEHRESESNESIVNNSANQVGHSPAPIDASRSTSEGPSTSPTDSVNMSVENRDDGDKSTVEEVEHVNVHQIAEAIKKLDKRMKVTQIRPPWRDPNSQTLPSDQTASFMDMYDEFMRPSKFRPFSANQRLEWQPHIAVNRPYHTTLNRYREQERIQMQNYVSVFVIHVLLLDGGWNNHKAKFLKNN